jgi:two-component system, sensor histidine kinase and response regulator
MKQHILVIEDSRTQARILEDLLLSIHCDVTVAIDGASAREKFNAVAYDLILLDMVLPDASGIQMINEINASPVSAGTPVIILSGVTDKGNIIDSINLGAKDYITKPYHQSEFLIRVKLHLEMLKADKELKQTVAAKDKLISVISHDLRDPFNGLLGFAELLVKRGKTLTEEQKEQYINQVYASAQGIHELLNNLTVWASFQNSEIIPNLKVVQPHELVEDSIALLKADADNKGIVVANHISKDHILQADPNMLGSVVRNLVANSLRIMTSGNITIGCHQKLVAENKGLEFVLQMSGVEFPSSILAATHRNGSAKPGKITQSGKGLGLGLSLAMDFVEAHKGTILFENVPGAGGEVRFFIPGAD